MDDVLALARAEQDELSAVIDLRDSQERLREVLTSAMKDLAPDALELVPGLESGVDEIIEELDIPDRIPLSEILDQEMALESQVAIERLQSYRTLVGFAPYGLSVALLLISWFLVGLSGGLKWFGTAILVSGSTLLFGLVVAGSGFINQFITDIQALPVDTEPLLVAVNYTASRMLPVPLSYIAAGLLLIIAGAVLGRRFAGRNHDA